MFSTFKGDLKKPHVLLKHGAFGVFATVILETISLTTATHPEALHVLEESFVTPMLAGVKRAVNKVIHFGAFLCWATQWGAVCALNEL